MSQVQLGFGPSPRPTYVYVSADHKPNCWYLFNFTESKQEPVDQPALTGLIKTVELGTKEHKGRENKKLRVHIAAGPRNYVIETGFYTAFARCLLAAFARLRREHFNTPIAIEPQIGEQDKTVFANVYNAENGKRINYDWPQSDADVDALFTRVEATLAEPAAPALAAAS